jgi:hypothetical protein
MYEMPEKLVFIWSKSDIRISCFKTHAGRLKDFYCMSAEDYKP